MPLQWTVKEGYAEIRGRECVITLEPRPHHCDRGNWLAKLFPIGRLAIEIDDADGWPRYYFDLARAKLEVEAWLVKRGQALPEPAPTPVEEPAHGKAEGRRDG